MTPTAQQEREQTMFKLVEKYLVSGQSQLSFSREHGIAKSTFQSWYKKYLQQDLSRLEEKSRQRFMPIRLSEPLNSPLTIELYYPNGICLKLSQLTDISQVTQLISSYPYVKP